MSTGFGAQGAAVRVCSDLSLQQYPLIQPGRCQLHLCWYTARSLTAGTPINRGGRLHVQLSTHDSDGASRGQAGPSRQSRQRPPIRSRLFAAELVACFISAIGARGKTNESHPAGDLAVDAEVDLWQHTGGLLHSGPLNISLPGIGRETGQPWSRHTPDLHLFQSHPSNIDVAINLV